MRHFHAHGEVFVQLSGKSRLTFPAGHVELTAGGVCIVPRGLPHEETLRPHRARYRNMVIGFNRGGVWAHFGVEEPRGKLRIVERVSVEVPYVQRLWDYLDDAVETAASRSDSARAATAGALVVFFATFIRALDGELEAGPREHFKVTRCRRMISERLGETRLSVAGLAGELGCSADYLSHLFCRQTGHRLTVYLNTQRVARARVMLATTALNVSEIARACGYADPGYFARQFRRITGQTASAYRAAART
jgi:AraC-like DNA-binding protein